MENKPLVSVITPAFNHGRYIGRTIESLLAQTYENWELVVIDDGSTDNTPEVIRSFKDKRIRHIRQENQGVKKLAQTINTGFRQTTGPLVTMLPSDDLWIPERLATQIHLFDDPNVVLCHARQWTIDENDSIVGETIVLAKEDVANNRPVGRALHGMMLVNFIMQPTVLIRRSALEKIGGYLQPEGLLAEDMPTHLALAQVGEFRFQNIPLAKYRMHQAQMTRNHYVEMIKTDETFILDFFRNLSPLMKERSGWDEHRLATALKRQVNNRFFGAGRRSLLQGQWAEARRSFMQAIRGGSTGTKLKASIGIACSFLHVDMERLAVLSGASAPFKK